MRVVGRVLDTPIYGPDPGLKLPRLEVPGLQSIAAGRVAYSLCYGP